MKPQINDIAARRIESEMNLLNEEGHGGFDTAYQALCVTMQYALAHAPTLVDGILLIISCFNVTVKQAANRGEK